MHRGPSSFGHACTPKSARSRSHAMHTINHDASRGLIPVQLKFSPKTKTTTLTWPATFTAQWNLHNSN
ncbi:predicted protein [Plenodomus lingam JN3]|uniref:Predicted protein n=1 Tax=Leptosphaeria maculans (strain JN3 / isolate v23.1.3 / race Av1-4-5-6-7-8) TaxID=985895 RepID=E4ZYJ7_LEPMJ|nr:predicted protein [Plenodomus lingam JN3]CBX96523.1 predicted protein [Plenodomus lingam JN3]